MLLVEDNINDEMLIRRALNKHNLANEMQVVHDGEEALDFLYSRGKYKGFDNLANLHLILLDLKLPKINGLDLLNIIKKDEKIQSIPIAILTSSTEDSDMLQAYRMGVNSYIVKPIDFDKFIAAVSGLGLHWVILNESPFREMNE